MESKTKNQSRVKKLKPNSPSTTRKKTEGLGENPFHTRDEGQEFKVGQGGTESQQTEGISCEFSSNNVSHAAKNSNLLPSNYEPK